MKTTSMLMLALYLLAGAHTAAVAQEHATPSASKEQLAQIRAVVEDFRTAIIAKDKDKFLKLFAKDNVSWIGVTDSAHMARHRQYLPDSKEEKAPLNWTHTGFITGIARDPTPSEEKFRNIQIDSDGEIASVRFDYSFHAGGKMTNWGKEAWQMVNTDSGWKIASVVWSMRFPPEPAPPARTEVALTSAQLAAYAGSYEIRPGNVLDIVLDGERLRVTQQGSVFPLYALGPAKFFDKAFGAVYEFVRDDFGVVTRIDMAIAGQAYKAVRK